MLYCQILGQIQEGQSADQVSSHRGLPADDLQASQTTFSGTKQVFSKTGCASSQVVLESMKNVNESAQAVMAMVGYVSHIKMGLHHNVVALRAPRGPSPRIRESVSCQHSLPGVHGLRKIRGHDQVSLKIKFLAMLTANT